MSCTYKDYEAFELAYYVHCFHISPVYYSGQTQHESCLGTTFCTTVPTPNAPMLGVACGGQTLGWSVMILLLIFMPLYNFFSLNVGRTCDFLLNNRMWQRWEEVTSLTMLHYIRLSCCQTCSRASPGWSDEGPVWLTWQGAAGSLQELRVASSPAPVGSWTLSSTHQGNEFYQQPEWAWELILP